MIFWTFSNSKHLGLFYNDNYRNVTCIRKHKKAGKKKTVMLTYLMCVYHSEMIITGTLPQAVNLKLFVPSLSTQGSTRPKQNIFNVVLMRPDKTE